MQHIREEDAEIYSGSGGDGHTIRHMIAPWTVGSANLWVGVTVLEPGARTKPSALEGVESVHLTLEGEGREVVEDTEIDTSAGSFVLIPTGALHQVINRGGGPLKLVSIATPPIARPG